MALTAMGAMFTTPRWTVVRNPADNAALAAAPYSTGNLSVNPATGLNTTMSVDQTGSFSVICYDDRNGNGRFDPGEPACYLNVVVAYITLVSDTCAGNNAVLTGNVGTSTFNIDGVATANLQYISARCGTFVVGGAGMSFAAQLTVVCGGANGALGAERIKTGWCNNGTGWTNLGLYSGGSSSACPTSSGAPGFAHHIFTYLTNQDFATVNFITIPANLPATIAPLVTAARPILDTGRNNPGTGGVTICLTRSAETVAAAALGQTRTTTALDAPGELMLINHPKFAGSRLCQYTFNPMFTAYLVAWGGTVAAAPAEPSANLYTMSSVRNWSDFQRYSMTYPGGTPTPNADPANGVTVGANVPHSPATPATGEVCIPVLTKRFFIRNATN